MNIKKQPLWIRLKRLEQENTCVFGPMLSDHHSVMLREDFPIQRFIASLPVTHSACVRLQQCLNHGTLFYEASLEQFAAKRPKKEAAPTLSHLPPRSQKGIKSLREAVQSQEFDEHRNIFLF